MQIADGVPGRRGRTCARATGSVYFCFGGNLAGRDAIVDAPGKPGKQSPDFELVKSYKKSGKDGKVKKYRLKIVCVTSCFSGYLVRGLKHTIIIALLCSGFSDQVLLSLFSNFFDVVTKMVTPQVLVST